MEQLGLWLWVIVLGTGFGAGLYEHRIAAPRWLATSPEGRLEWRADAARRDDSGRRFWAFVSTGPLTLLTLVNLVAAWRSTGASREIWLLAAGIGLTERVLTFSYFIPAMVRLMDAANSVEAVATAKLWLQVNYLRHGLTLAAWLAALRTLVVHTAPVS